MAEFSAQELREAARKAAAAGRTDVAKSLIAKGLAAEQSQRGLLDVAGDVMRSTASGIARGATGMLDFPAQVPGLVAQGGSFIGEKMGLVDPEAGAKFRQDISQMGAMGGAGATARRAAPDVMGYAPETTAGEYARTVGEFLPGMAFGGTAPQMVAAGLGSEVAGQATEGTKYEPAARLGGALAGGLAPGAAKRAITPNPADPARTAAARSLSSEGVKLTAGQKTGNVNLMYQEAMTPRTVQMMADQSDDFTAAVLKRIGVTANRAEPEILNDAYKRIGGVFDDLASRNQIAVDRPLVTKINDVVRKYEQGTNKNNIAPVVGNIADKIRAKLRSGTPISGADYQQYRSDLGPLVTSSDRQLSKAASGLRVGLDDAMERTITAAGNADDIAAYASVRQQYRDYLAIEGAAAKPGRDAAYGVINPRQLRSEVVRVRGKRSYTTGKADLGELARRGNMAMNPLPQSGTQPRIAANTIGALSGGGTGIGAGGLAYALTKDPNIAAAAGVAGALAPVLRNSAKGSALGQSYLSNQLLPAQSQNILRQLEQGLVPALANSSNR